ncbi:MAG TPA: hypothetical protein VFI55_08810 [Mycobacterium sp.]|nr:hypothetical protein [Mycobacterium sp.]
MPDTDAISPLTCAWPFAGGEVVAEAPGGLVLELGAVGLDAGLDVVDEPHAAMDSVAAPVAASTAKRVSRGMRELTDNNISPIVGWPDDRLYPLELCPTYVYWNVYSAV